MTCCVVTSCRKQLELNKHRIRNLSEQLEPLMQTLNKYSEMSHTHTSDIPSNNIKQILERHPETRDLNRVKFLAAVQRLCVPPTTFAFSQDFGGRPQTRIASLSAAV